MNLHRDTVKQECLLYTCKNTSNVVQENSQLPRAMTRSYDNFCASLLTQAVMLPRHRKPRPCKPGIQQHAFWGSRSSTGRKAQPAGGNRLGKKRGFQCGPPGTNLARVSPTLHTVIESFFCLQRPSLRQVHDPGDSSKRARKSSELHFFTSNWYGDACGSHRRKGSHGSGNPDGLSVTNVRRCWPSLRTLRLRGYSLRSERFIFLPPPANRNLRGNHERGPMNERVDSRPKHSVTASYRPFVWGLQPLST